MYTLWARIPFVDRKLTFTFNPTGTNTDDMLGADVWIERTLSFNDLGFDDDLSLDAPSYCVDISF